MSEVREFVLRCTVNDVSHELRVPALRRLLDVVRDDLGLTGTKEGCGEGECGACTVLIDGAAVNSCLVPACQVEGSAITTIESSRLARVQSAFLEHGGAQCGICTPGMILMTQAWIEACGRGEASIDAESARKALAGNLCRCTGYQKILAAALGAAAKP